MYRRSPASRLLAAAVVTLAAVAAVVYAVRLIMSVWFPLVVIACVVLAIAGSVAALKGKSRGW